MLLTETKLALEDLDQFSGTLLVTDAQLVAADSGILRLGDDGGLFVTHIVCPMGPHTAHRLLDDAFKEFSTACCHDLRCDFIVSYYVDDEVLFRRAYGLTGGAYTVHINVYCGDDVSVEEVRKELLWATSCARPLIVVDPDSSQFGFGVTRFA